MRIFIFSISLLFIILPEPLYGEERGILNKKEVVLLYEQPLRMAAEEAADIYPVLKRELEKTLGWRVNFRPTVLLIKESKAFQKAAGNDLIVAFAIPKKYLIVIDYSKMRTRPFSIDTTLKHELCHLLLHSHIKKEGLPRWLDEGIAQWVSGGMAEIMMNQSRSVLDEAILSGKHINIRALSEGFPENRKSLLLAYEVSKSLVEYIIRKFGRDGILLVLQHLKDGDTMDRAILKGLSISFDELERRWQDHLKKRATWFLYLINHLYEILFFLAALLMIYGFIRSLIKKRAYRHEEEDNTFLL